MNLGQVNRIIRNAVGVVVRSPQELQLVLKSFKGGITKLTLEGKDFTYRDIQTLPPFIRELSAPRLQILADQLVELKRLLPNLESLTVGCKAWSRQESTAWTKAANATSCKVTIATWNLLGVGVPEPLGGLLIQDLRT